MLKARPTLQRRLALGLAAFTSLVVLVVAGHGYWVNERSEAAVWKSLLQTEMNYFIAKRAADPTYAWPDTDILTLYEGGTLPPQFDVLSPGLHDEVVRAARKYVVLVQPEGARKLVLALDITDQEEDEATLLAALSTSVVLVAVLLAAIVYWGVGRLMRPLTLLAASIEDLPPDGTGAALPVGPGSPREVAVVAESVNGYRGRIREFVERERAFINLASHELRSPVTVVLGSTEVALDHPDTTPALRPHIFRAYQTAKAMEELAEMLLSLARDPDRILRDAQVVSVAEELESIVADYAFITRDKELTLSLEVAQDVTIEAPKQVLRSIIGNLIRNAIENSDRGVIRIRSPYAQAIVVEDSGHGMTAGEMASLHARIVRSGYTSTSGIGLGLISRLCEHFGWAFDLQSNPAAGTVATITFPRQTGRPHAQAAAPPQSA